MMSKLFPTISRQLASVDPAKLIASPVIVLIDGAMLLIITLDTLRSLGVFG